MDFDPNINHLTFIIRNLSLLRQVARFLITVLVLLALEMEIQ
jgi:hypothetical protein